MIFFILKLEKYVVRIDEYYSYLVMYVFNLNVFLLVLFI